MDDYVEWLLQDRDTEPSLQTDRHYSRNRKRVRNSFLIKQIYAYQLRNIEAKETMAYYQDKRSPRFERISQARQWLEEQEENRLQGEKI
ncbi:unnamed protein product, partial [Porites evermanni]